MIEIARERLRRGGGLLRLLWNGLLVDADQRLPGLPVEDVSQPVFPTSAIALRRRPPTFTSMRTTGLTAS